ncbi:unnamed protein product, partial [Amoebophrya sp. A25]
ANEHDRRGDQSAGHSDAVRNEARPFGKAQAQRTSAHTAGRGSNIRVDLPHRMVAVRADVESAGLYAGHHSHEVHL